jgi:hypothetical protein
LCPEDYEERQSHQEDLQEGGYCTTSVKQLKAHAVKEESEEEGDDIQEVEQEDVEEGGPTAPS